MAEVEAGRLVDGEGDAAVARDRVDCKTEDWRL